MNRCLQSVWIILLIAGYPSLSAQFNLENFEIIPFTENASGTQSFINSMVEDPQGYIWIGTYDGLYRYDGFNFKAFIPPNDPQGQQGLMIGKLLVKGDYLYACSTRGLQVIHLPSNTITNKTFATTGDVAANVIHDIQEDIHGKLWVNSRVALHQMDQPYETLQTIPLPDTLVSPNKMGIYVKLIILQNDHILFEGYQSQGKWALLNYDQIKNRFSFIDQFPSNQLLTTLQIGPTSIFYVSLPQMPEIGTINALDGSKQSLSARPEILRKKSVVSLYKFDQNQVLVNINQYKYLFDFGSKKFRDLNLPQFLIDLTSDQEMHYNLFRTSRGETLGTCSQGLIRFIDEAGLFQKYYNLDDIFTLKDYGAVVEIWKDKSATWVLNHGEGGAILSNDGTVKERINFGRDSPLSDYWWNISRYADDTVWIGTSVGLYWYDVTGKRFGRLRHKSLPAAIHKYAITTQFEDSRKELWMGIGAGHGLVRWSPDRNSAYHYSSADDGLPIRYPKAIAEDGNGDLWMGCQTGGGLVKWVRDLDSFLVVSPALDSVFSNDLIDAITVSKEGKIYFGGGGGGLFEYDPTHQSFRNWSQAQGLSNQYILDLCWDQNNDLWIGTLNGLNRMDLHNNNIASFFMEHGLPSNQVESIQSASDTTLFVFTPKGTRTFNPDRIEKSPVHQPLRITELLINGENCNDRLRELDDLKLSYRQNNLTFEISQVNLTTGKLNKYQYRMDELQPEWTLLNAGNQLQLISLSPGRYQLQFQVCNNNVCQMADQVAILIRPPFWRSPLFFFLLAVCLIGMVMGYHQMQLRSIIKRQNLRNQISADLHDDIGSSLSSIGFITEMMAKDKLSNPENQQRLASIKEEIGLINQNLEEIIWYIKPSTDTLHEIHLKLRRFSTELLESKEIKLIWEQTSEINMTLDSHTKRDYFLIFKEIINNIAKHSRATQVRVLIAQKSSTLHLEVVDNGIGFDPDHDFDSNGLHSLHFRAIRLKGVLKIKSAPGMGSQTVLRFPLH